MEIYLCLRFFFYSACKFTSDKNITQGIFNFKQKYAFNKQKFCLVYCTINSFKQNFL